MASNKRKLDTEERPLPMKCHLPPKVPKKLEVLQRRILSKYDSEAVNSILETIFTYLLEYPDSPKSRNFALWSIHVMWDQTSNYPECLIAKWRTLFKPIVKKKSKKHPKAALFVRLGLEILWIIGFKKTPLKKVPDAQKFVDRFAQLLDVVGKKNKAQTLSKVRTIVAEQPALQGPFLKLITSSPKKFSTLANVFLSYITERKQKALWEEYSSKFIEAYTSLVTSKDEVPSEYLQNYSPILRKLRSKEYDAILEQVISLSKRDSSKLPRLCVLLSSSRFDSSAHASTISSMAELDLRSREHVKKRKRVRSLIKVSQKDNGPINIPKARANDS
jgi:hypothetical protein